eukprot:2810242-Pyramimonas_sp.AAC.2
MPGRARRRARAPRGADHAPARATRRLGVPGYSTPRWRGCIAGHGLWPWRNEQRGRAREQRAPAPQRASAAPASPPPANPERSGSFRCKGGLALFCLKLPSRGRADCRAAARLDRSAQRAGGILRPHA